jgi:hypothetical protein
MSRVSKEADEIMAEYAKHAAVVRGANAEKMILTMRGWVRSNVTLMMTSKEGQQLIRMLGGKIVPARVVFPGEE